MGRLLVFLKVSFTQQWGKDVGELYSVLNETGGEAQAERRGAANGAFPANGARSDKTCPVE